jgi:ATP-dependent DNA helicase RecG
VNQDELGKLLQCEDDRIEWKQSAKDKDGILRAVCALANDLGDSRRPGFLLIGVAPKTGRIEGLGDRGSKLMKNSRSSRAAYNR